MIFNLTKRLEAIYDMVPKDKTIADIGTDHARLAVALIKGEKAEKVIATDVNKGPFETAKTYVNTVSLCDKIDCRLGNGLQVLNPNEADTVILCGMGGYLMADILQDAPYKPKRLILQPQNGYKSLKKYLINMGYKVEAESLVKDMGHIYEIWRYSREEKVTPNFYATLDEDHILWEIGALLFEKGHALFKERLETYMSIDKSILQSMSIKEDRTEKYKQIEKHFHALEDIYEDYCKKHS